MWVPLVENNEHNDPGADYFVRKNITEVLAQDKNIDTILLACTHYPLLRNKMLQFLPEGVTLLSQGEIVANSLVDYLKRHQEIEERITRNTSRRFYTTDSTTDFDNHASIFFGETVNSVHADL